MPLETPASHSKPLPRSQGFATRHSGGVHVLPPRSEGAPAARTQRRRESCEVQHWWRSEFDSFGERVDQF
jgi:hypothetical protein